MRLSRLARAFSSKPARGISIVRASPSFCEGIDSSVGSSLGSSFSSLWRASCGLSVASSTLSSSASSFVWPAGSKPATISVSRMSISFSSSAETTPSLLMWKSPTRYAQLGTPRYSFLLPSMRAISLTSSLRLAPVTLKFSSIFHSS